jgi:hypothetical protein
VSTYRRYDGSSPSVHSGVDRARRRLARPADTRIKGTLGAGRSSPVDAPIRPRNPDVPPVPIRLLVAPGVPAQRGEPWRSWWVPRFLSRPLGPPDPGERYKIDPQFVPRVLEQVI